VSHASPHPPHRNPTYLIIAFLHPPPLYPSLPLVADFQGLFSRNFPFNVAQQQLVTSKNPSGIELRHSAFGT
jgi:hypothetical protein